MRNLILRVQTRTLTTRTATRMATRTATRTTTVIKQEIGLIAQVACSPSQLPVVAGVPVRPAATGWQWKAPRPRGLGPLKLTSCAPP